VRAIEQNLRF